MNEPTHQQWLDNAAQQARDLIACLHQEGLDSLRERPSRELFRTPPPAGVAAGQHAEDADRFGGLL